MISSVVPLFPYQTILAVAHEGRFVVNPKPKNVLFFLNPGGDWNPGKGA